jgi:hypothetical protein
LLETGDLDEATVGAGPSVTRFEELLSAALGSDVAVWIDPVVNRLSIALNAENRRRLETVVRLLAVVSRGRITVVDQGEQVQRYVLQGGALLQEGHLVLTGRLRALSGW